MGEKDAHGTEGAGLQGQQKAREAERLARLMLYGALTILGGLALVVVAE